MFKVSTHSRPKAAGLTNGVSLGVSRVSTHSRPKAAGTYSRITCEKSLKFQHTAARRRLVVVKAWQYFVGNVSTHSRPKAAGEALYWGVEAAIRFNTQPPEGGWRLAVRLHSCCDCFNTQPPEGGWNRPSFATPTKIEFQHTAARRRLASTFSVLITFIKFQHTAARRRLAQSDTAAS